MQGILSKLFSIEKLSMLSSEEVIALDKRFKMFSWSINTIFNPQVTPIIIAISQSGTNIESI
jgi:hypothetical protein